MGLLLVFLLLLAADLVYYAIDLTFGVPDVVVLIFVLAITPLLIGAFLRTVVGALPGDPLALRVTVIEKQELETEYQPGYILAARHLLGETLRVRVDAAFSLLRSGPSPEDGTFPRLEELQVSRRHVYAQISVQEEVVLLSADNRRPLALLSDTCARLIKQLEQRNKWLEKQYGDVVGLIDANSATIRGLTRLALPDPVAREPHSSV
jgi:hypothetical protein